MYSVSTTFEIKSELNMIKMNDKKRVLLVAGILCVAVAIAYINQRGEITFNFSFAANAPELPRAYVDTTYPVLPSGHTVRSVKASCSGVTNCYTSLQSAIDAAALGEEIVVDPGLTFYGPITLKNKTSGSGWLVIRTADMGGMPPVGSRVSPTNSSSMPKIVSNGYNVNAIQTQDYAHNYWITGFEVTETAKDDPNVLVALGSTTSYCATSTDLYKICDSSVLDRVPTQIILDRMYIHGLPGYNIKRGVSLDDKNSAVINSYLTDFHVVGQDAQAIAGLYGPGPYKIFNNYLAGAGENVIFGGDDPRVQDLIPSDIEIRNNYFTKPLSWRPGDPTFNGRGWTVKNVLEFKNAQRGLIDGNIIENSWVAGQDGFLVLFNTTNQGGKCTWCAVMDMTMTNNIVRHGANGVSFQGNDYNFLSVDTGLTQRIKVENNLFYDIDGNKWRELTSTRTGWGAFLHIPATNRYAPVDLRINHNTAIQAGRTAMVTNCTDTTTGKSCGSSTLPENRQFWSKPRFDYTNNIAYHSTYGFFGDGSSIDNPTLLSYFPSSVITKNVIVGQRSSTDTRDWSGNYSSFPGNYFPKDWETVAFMDMGNNNYRLSSTSPYKGAGTDGKDVGADIDAVSNATSGVLTGTPLPPPTGPLPPPPGPLPPPPPPTTSSPDTTAPIFDSYSVTPSTLAPGSTVTGEFSGTDQGGSHFAYARFMRTPYNSSTCSETTRTACSWNEVSRLSAPAGLDSWSGTVTDTPASGVYLYGLQLWDSAGNKRVEPNVVKVSVGSTTPPPSPTSDTTKPTVDSFNVSPTAGDYPITVTSDFTVSDTGGSYINRVESFRADYDASVCSDTARTACSWVKLATTQAPSNVNTWTSNFIDQPNAGTYWYGLHVVDNAGNYGVEPKLFKVTISSATPPPPPPSPTPSGPNGLKGEYFSDRFLRHLDFIQYDDNVDFDWGNDSPAGLGSNNFSIRWTGSIMPNYSETYTFTALSDDGVRFWVNGQLVIDNWVEQSAAESSGTISLVAGQKYDIKIEYFERLGSATAKLYWSSASQAKAIVPKSALFIP